jgi:hypothetical protein
MVITLLTAGCCSVAKSCEGMSYTIMMPYFVQDNAVCVASQLSLVAVFVWPTMDCSHECGIVVSSTITVFKGGWKQGMLNCIQRRH